MKLLTLILFAGSLLAQQSLVGGSASIGAGFPNRSKALPYRAEFYLHDWPASPITARPFRADGIGFDAYYSGGNQLIVYSQWDSGVTFNIPLSLFATKRMYVRFQRDPSVTIHYCEAWDENGILRFTSSNSYTPQTTTNLTGADITTGATVGSTAWARIHTNIVPLNSRPPTTVDDANRLAEWKLENNLLDSSGNGYAMTVGSANTFGATPDLGNYSKPKIKATTWSDWTSLRAGVAEPITGSGSYSQSPTSNAVTCFWQQLSGPSQVTFGDRALCDTTVSGTVFGTYRFSLTVVGASGSPSTATIEVGAVATDDNGVVISANPNVEKVFGPMIAFGKSPWGRVDERQQYMASAIPAYNTERGYPVGGPVWTTKAAGTVAYPWTTKGFGLPGTTLSAGINSTTLSIPIANASALSLTNLPTWILIGPALSTQELVRICATTATSGPATLTVCTAGRGVAGELLQGNSTAQAQAFSSGTLVGELRINGTGTSFLSDANRPICPLGYGPPGASVYNTGTTSITSGSAVITGSGTTWNTGNGLAVGMMVRLVTTPIWWARITSIDSTTQITLDRPVPSAISSGSYSYNVVGPRYLGIDYLQADGRVNPMAMVSHGCESETAMFGYGIYDGLSLNTNSESGRQVSYFSTFGAASAFGPNFYGSGGMALRAFHLRSGLTSALTGARQMDDYWVRGPELSLGGGLPLLYGGGVLGAFASLVTDPETPLDWRDVRKYIQQNLGSNGPVVLDTRETGYKEAILAMGALFDPDSVQKASWESGLASMVTWNNTYKGTDNSWRNGFYWNAAGPEVTFTNGSTAGTGTGLPSSICQITATGNGTVTTGIASLSVTSGTLASANHILITGTVSGVSTTISYLYTFVGSTATLSGVWPGDSGSVTWAIEGAVGAAGDAAALTTWGSSNTDTDLNFNYGCTWNSATSITLHRTWRGVSGPHRPYSGNLAGNGQQPFFMGIKNYAAFLGRQVPSVASSYTTTSSQIGGWLRDVGYDPTTQSLAYGNLFEWCTPGRITPAGSFQWTTSQCQNGAGNLAEGRINTSEVTAALSSLYLISGLSTDKTFADEAFNAEWCATGYDVGTGLSCDGFGPAATVNGSLGNVALSTYKWPGFHFGMGMAHQWPAARLGGVTPKTTISKPIQARLADIPGAVDIVVDYLAADGTVTPSSPCTSAACTFATDARQNYQYRVRYRNGSAANLAVGAYLPVR
jgi:hypothetical protein